MKVSKSDLELIETSWSLIESKQYLGLITMIKIFNLSKDLKVMFNKDDDVDFDDVDKSILINYANQMIEALNKIIIMMTKYSNKDEYIFELIELGKRHYYFGIKQEHFKIFENCLIKSLKDILNVNDKQQVIFNQDHELAWRHLLKNILYHYMDGIYLEKIFEDLPKRLFEDL